MKGLVVVVNYNQEDEAEGFLKKLKGFYALEHIVFVDDASTDKSPQIAQGLGYKVLKHEINQGVGAAIRSGINYAHENHYDYVIIMSSNGKMLPEELYRIISPIESGEYDYVTGSRYIKGGSSPGIGLFRNTVIPIFSLAATFCFNRNFSDITCGYRAYKLDFLKKFQINIHQDWLNRYELEYYIHYYACKSGLRIKEVPVTILYSHLLPGRDSKIRPIIDWWKIIRPLLFLKLGIKK